MIVKFSMFFDKSLNDQIEKNPAFASCPGLTRALRLPSDFLKGRLRFVSKTTQVEERAIDKVFKNSNRIEATFLYKDELVIVNFQFFKKSARKPFASTQKVVDEQSEMALDVLGHVMIH